MKSSSLSTVQGPFHIITDDDLLGLPPAIHRYMKYSQVVGTEQVNHFKVVFTGRFKLKKDDPWRNVSAEQYSFIDEGRRLFRMDMTYKGLPVNALHHYNRETASMTIKILDLIRVVHNEDVFMHKGETVTWFNDLCIMAPAALLRADVRWEEIDSHTVKGKLTQNSQTVEAVLTIDDEGKLTNFQSDDRFAANNDGTYDKLPWSTPMHEFKEVNGLQLGVSGEAIWHYPEGDFAYIFLNIEDVIVNPQQD